ncbi:MAG: ATP-binding cassette domain-containing protein [bacterium]
MVVLQARELYRFFHIGDEETAALRGVSLSLAAGETVAIMGPSGSGKSTLLNCLTGLDEPDAGQVFIMDQPLSRRPEGERARLRAAHFGILMQSGNLFQHMSVAGNIRFQMRLNQQVVEARIAALLDDVGLSHRAQANPANLSGGETARAGLAVALACNPQVLIADEPTAEVDAATEERLLEQFDTRRRSGLATLIATHSAALARRADRIIRLVDGKVKDD